MFPAERRCFKTKKKAVNWARRNYPGIPVTPRKRGKDWCVDIPFE